MKPIAIICTGGNGPLALPPTLDVPENTYVIAADSGLEVAHRLGLRVNHAIGDFDSLKNLPLLDQTEHTILSTEKDISDTEAALIHLKKLNIDQYILIGGGEGRFDHLLHLYSLFSLYGPPIEWITEKEHIYTILDQKEYFFPIHATISVLPIHMESNSVVNCQGLQWPLSEYFIDATHMSLSNRVIHSPLVMHIKGDPVFICHINEKKLP